MAGMIRIHLVRKKANAETLRRMLRRTGAVGSVAIALTINTIYIEWNEKVSGQLSNYEVK
jgi:hypothetical protein